MEPVFKVKGLKKEDLKFVAEELGEIISQELNIADIKRKISENQATKEDPEFVRELLTTAVAEREEVKLKLKEEREELKLKEEREELKLKEEREFELIRAKQENDLKIELAKIQATQVANPNTFNPQIALIEDSNIKRKFSLPKLEFRKFGGDLKEWLPFWGQFSKIHDDEEIAPEDKFQYLVQTTIEGSRARELVASFPPTGENYAKAVDSLKTRFGKEDLLIEVYVRELLKLIISVQTQEKPCITYLYDKLESYLRALDTLGVTTDKCASILYPMVESCFPHDFLKAWNRSATSHTKKEATDRLDDLMDFLKTEVEGEERICLAMSGFGLNKNNETKPKKKRIDESSIRIPTASSLLTTTDKVPVCIFCEKAHKSHECKATSSMTYDEKKSILLRKDACFKCLRTNHHSRSCKMVNLKCFKCGGRGHNTVMCYGKRATISSKDTHPEVTNNTSSANNSVLSNQTGTEGMDVVLQTLNIRVSNDDKEVLIRAMIDTGSQRSYATEEVIELLGFESKKEVKIVHTLFGGKQTEEEIHKEYILNLSDVENTFNCRIQVLDQRNICNELARVPIGEWIIELERLNICISDREDQRSCIDNKIHLLIGADVAGKLLTGKLHYCKTGPVALHTKLGWTLMGKVPRAEDRKCNALTVTSLLCNNIDNLWKLDVIGITEFLDDKSEELIREETIAHFKKTVQRDCKGRYEVALPWIHERENLDNNIEVARKRLNITKKRLENSGHITEYGAIFQEWLSKGIIELAHEISDNGVHYLPHRAVIKESSRTTKIRPVFDASAKRKGMLSLNDCLEKGPNMVATIPSLLTKFRLKAVAITSDIEKAFLQIGIQESDRDYLRFLWLDAEQRIVEYRHKRVVFGVTSSPFLLNVTLNHHLENSPENLHATALLLKTSFYIDNCITSFDNVEEMEKFVLESRVLLASAQFNLRDWICNVFSRVIDHTEFESTSLLGLTWNVHDDTLSCVVRNADSEGPFTKRRVLSVSSSIFDPIGYTSPVMLIPKMILQKSWTLKLSWDEEMPEVISKDFQKWLKNLPKLSEIRVPRWILQTDKELAQLHMFCDASQNAYATCIFLRYATANQIECALVQARSRVAPLKKLSIPRLELLACLIGARLAQKVIIDIGFENLSITYWSDSTNALYWIKRNENWSIFVMNRVEEIRKLANPDCWRHIPGVENPADLASRGCSADKLLQLKWWEGPQWLRKSEENWPTSTVIPNMDIIKAEKRKTIVVATNVSVTAFEYFSKISAFRKIVRVMGWIVRFIKNCKETRKRICGELTVAEVKYAETVIWRQVQKESLQNKSFNFQTYLDEDGLLKVKSRISMREDLKTFRFPVILPSGHQIVEKLIFEEHVENSHAGIQVLMTKLRESYWILKSRRTIRKVLKKCIRCARFTSSPIEIPGAPLPEDRVRDARVFEVTGVDLCGPMYLKDKTKCWAVLFTCALYRAVHIELVTLLSTDSFILALRRFISRRGRPTTIYSDNGTNLVGTANAFQYVNWETIQEISTIKKIQWKLNPPSAPWWGGFWERLIGTLKRILRRVMGNASLQHDELSTILCEAESLFNSRPLTYVSEDVNDLQVLSPAMFLNEIEEVGTADFDEIDAKRLNRRFAYRLTLRKDLQKRFRIEYLGQLREHYKVKKEHHVKEGDVVLLGDSNTKRISWPLARISKLYPGKDGRFRLAEVKTNSGTYLRPLQRLYPLEVQDAERSLFQPKDSPPKTIGLELKDKEMPTRKMTRYGRRTRTPNRLNL